MRDGVDDDELEAGKRLCSPELRGALVVPEEFEPEEPELASPLDELPLDVVVVVLPLGTAWAAATAGIVNPNVMASVVRARMDLVMAIAPRLEV